MHFSLSSAAKTGMMSCRALEIFFLLYVKCPFIPKPSKALPALSEDLQGIVEVNSFEALLAPSKAFPAASDLSASPSFYSSRTEYLSE